MASILSGYEYDIFVSYRHNDNKYDGWVSEFVEKLKQELDATLKDKLTVYFDKNLQEGLLDVHQVHESLQAKIKSLIFIPIISQTYCDVNSFAWKNEFITFLNEADRDSIGKTVRTASGNVISRVLPIKIHDIEPDDVRLLERELGGIMRSIDFIYQDAGVNRPLRSKDDDLSGAQTRLLFRNQINKVANSIKEVVSGIKMTSKAEPKPTSSHSLTLDKPLTTGSISTSLPPGIKVHVIDRSKPTIFLAWTSSELKAQREEMALVLQKAGFSVLPSTDCPADDEEFKVRVAENLAKCSCSLHILGNEFGRRFEVESEISFPQYQLNEVKKLVEPASSEFQSFIWNVNNPAKPVNASQQDFIRSIRNNITRNMMFSNSAGAMQLVDDIRVVMMKEEVKLFDSKDTDIFFIFNQQDENDAGRITDLISEYYPIETLNIMPDGDESYREKSAQQIPRSKLAVVYFKYAADWAIPFVKQIWKEIGGASSPTQIMLVGENDPATNASRVFKAPKVVSSIVPKEEVPEEVKKVYVKVVQL
ncbi:MAG: hypothetical protein K2U26_06600 [Cyclobacteriaceae bacterium]|nr:hypothetical protein [Cyclobacteriaceae bacterium]